MCFCALTSNASGKQIELHYLEGIVLITLAGLPVTTTLSSTDFVTKLPAPTVDPEQIVIPPKIIAPAPIHTSSIMVIDLLVLQIDFGLPLSSGMTLSDGSIGCPVVTNVDLGPTAIWLPNFISAPS